LLKDGVIKGMVNKLPLNNALSSLYIEPIFILSVITFSVNLLSILFYI